MLVIGSAPGITSCAVNPVTGERELALISERQEIEIGRSADPDITRALGLYDDPEWQRYVQDVGERRARRSERPELPWTIRVLDDPTVNAFALPGGYLYLTRGILTHFSSEAEMAGVLGHEIGHVTARHGVRQMSRAGLAQLGLGVGMVLFPELEGLGQLAGAGLGLLFLSYGRDDERQADDLGLRYMTDQGYDPTEMAATFEMLARASGAESGSGIPSFLSTHPDPLSRRDRILARVEAGEVSGERVARQEYLQRLDGMVFGPNPREGYFRDGLFLHPDMAFQIAFPSGWRGLNQRHAVQAVHPEQDAVLVLELAEQPSARAGLDAFLGQDGITGGGLSAAPVNGLPAARAEFRARTQEMTLLGVAVFVEHGGRVFRILGYTTEARWGARQQALRGSPLTFQRVTDRAVLDVEPNRIQLVRTDGPMTLEQFYQRHPSAVPIEVIGTINRVQPGETIPAGTLVKRVAGQPLP
jgi:predicted Zn-dependent protease